MQGAQVANKTFRKSQRDGEGHIKCDGEIMHKKGDAYMVGCTETGADSGTSDASKLSLEYLFKEKTSP